MSGGRGRSGKTRVCCARRQEIRDRFRECFESECEGILVRWGCTYCLRARRGFDCGVALAVELLQSGGIGGRDDRINVVVWATGER